MALSPSNSYKWTIKQARQPTASVGLELNARDGNTNIDVIYDDRCLI